MARFLGILLAVVLHAGFLLFGGLLFSRDKEDRGTLQQVDLLSSDEAAADKDKDKRKETPAEKQEPIDAEPEPPPDSAEIIRTLELSAASNAPALEAASLGAIEAALNGQGGGGDFAEALSFASGGRIGGMGKGGPLEDKLESALSITEIDQQPRAVLQPAPVYPAEMRGKKLEGVVTLIFVVDASGKVQTPRVLSSNHPAFDRPALDAVRQWRFEPGLKAGQRVGCKVRIDIRFPKS